MRWCFDDGSNRYADHVLDRLLNNNQALVPVLWLYEVASVLSKAQRRGILPAFKAQGFLTNLRTLDIVVEEVAHDRILVDVFALANRFGLSGYDASYLELAKRKTIPLATLDEELRQAAKAAGVTLIAG